MENLIRKFWPGLVAQDEVSEFVLMADIVLEMEVKKDYYEETIKILKSRECNTIIKLKQQEVSTLKNMGIQLELAEEILRLIKSGAPEFNNYETYTYFCVIVWPRLCEKLRQ